MTDEDTTDDRGSPRTLGEIPHTNPHTGAAFGDTMTYDRGRTVAADGGERDPADAEAADAEADDAEADADDADGTPLREIDHTPPAEADGANNVYQRGNEGREEDA